MSESKVAAPVGVSQQVTVDIIFGGDVVKKPLDHWIVDLINAVDNLIKVAQSQEQLIRDLRADLTNHNHYEQPINGMT